MDITEEADSINRRYLECGGHRGKGIAVLTSGGDSQGMNAAIRAVVRTALYLGCNVFFVREGYQGLVDGDITIATWSSVSSIIHKGGTVIGSARCKEFRTVEGRAKAAKNLIDLGVNNLVVIGGDGSLTGANMFREEWKMHLDNLIEKGEVSADSIEDMECLNIVGIVGSIDNDFCGTDMTIGTDSALLRILEAIDAIACTAYSHQRTFIMEVMGRHCGYLAISAGLLCGATAVFLPEDPPEEWENDLCETIKREREAGQRLNIIIVAEGALDRSGNPITSEMIKDVVVDRLKQDTRISVLGHIQRGGSPSAFDRVLGCRMGAEAVLALLEATPETEAVVITLTGNHSKRLPLMECVEMTKKAAQALVDKNWARAVELRGRTFKRRLEVYKTMHMVEKKNRTSFIEKGPFVVAVVHIGAPACGMNSTVRSFVRTALNYNIRVYGITQGIDGLVLGDFHEMKWADVNGWVGEGGALLGTRRTLPRNKMNEIAAKFKQYGIQGLFIIGGFEAFLSALMFYEERPNYNEFCIPILVAAATISNNVPGSDCSIGCDTALNEIVEICDRMRQSAQGTKRRVFIVETMGGYCGYLATLAGIAGGADAAYIYEEKFSIKDLHKDLYNMASKMSAGVQRGLILRNEKCNENYNCDFMTRLYAEEGKGVFTARSNIIGHMQQGGSSSPFDRSMGITIGIKAVKWFVDILGKNLSCDISSPETVAVVGLVNKMYQFTSVPELAKTTDFEKRIPKKQWWMKLRPLLRIISKHESIYEEGTFMYYDAAAVGNKNSSMIMV